jgi:hypothetical protein
METGLLHLHSFLRWVAILAIILAIYNAFTGMKKNSPFGKNDNRWSLITLITFHIQLVIGLVLYFTQGWHLQVGEMANKVVRFYSVEHILAMIIVVVLVTVGRVRAKKAATDLVKHQRHFRFFLIAFVIMMVSIPWPFREVGMGKSWFPGL